MARAKALAGGSLYQRDFCLWLEQQAALLRERRFEELDLAQSDRRDRGDGAR